MRRIIRILLLLLLSAIILFPLLYALSASFFTKVDFTAPAARFLPSSPSFRNYALALGNSHFSRYALNSLITASLTAFLRTGVAASAAFAFTHLHFRGQRALLIALLATLFIPSDAMLYENYITTARLGLLDSYPGIVLPSILSASAILMMAGAYNGIDRDVYDAARIDGASDIRYILTLLIPLTAPVTGAVFIQAFVSSFNSYLWPLLVTTRPSMRTIQIGITMLGFAEEGELGAQFASIMLITIPFLLILALSRRLIMNALSGGVHG